MIKFNLKIGDRLQPAKFTQLDVLLLASLIEGGQVVPVGGKHGMPAFIEGYLGNWAAEHIDVDKHPDLKQLADLAKGANT